MEKEKEDFGNGPYRITMSVPRPIFSDLTTFMLSNILLGRFLFSYPQTSHHITAFITNHPHKPGIQAVHALL